jgi:phage virion morphogenesis protein
VSFEITIEADHLIRALDKARHKIGSNEVLTSIGLSLLRANEKRHEAHQAPDGKSWTKLKDKTIARKKNPRWLVEEGDMLRFYSRVDGDSVVIGTADKKAYWHHAGTSRGLPERPLVGFAELDQRLVKDLIEDHLQVILRSVR